MPHDHPTLENDAIREAVFEVRFQRSADVVPEIFFGKIADVHDWQGYKQVRLPISEIPESIRRSDASFHHKPVIELVSPDAKTAIRMGPDVIVLSRRGDYQGWEGGFGEGIRQLCERLFEVLGEVTVVRLGMRYINALRSDVHGVNGCQDLRLDLAVADENIVSAFNLNFITNQGSNFEGMNRISTVEFAGGAIPENTTVVIDIDVRTSNGFETTKITDVLEWAENARHEKNTRFFSVLGAENTERLRKK